MYKLIKSFITRIKKLKKEILDKCNAIKMKRIEMDEKNNIQKRYMIILGGYVIDFTPFFKLLNYRETKQLYAFCKDKSVEGHLMFLIKMIELAEKKGKPVSQELSLLMSDETLDTETKFKKLVILLGTEE